MTERLYYNDPYLREFDATITRVDASAGHIAITLDRTAFYPTTGGQPFDTGTLNDVAVVDVVDSDDGSIAHLASRASNASALQVGLRVHGAIDWPRRFDHMQQHTGQHVLSAAFDRLFGVRTVSFHLGAAGSTIDLARELTPGGIAAAEDLANRIVWEDRGVAVRYADADEAAKLPLRKESLREGLLRLIDVHDFDLSACGGTHVARTGAIGVIAVASWERFKGGQRVEFLCGGRALARFRSLRDVVASAVRSFSVLPEELPSAIERVQADAKESRRALSALRTDLARYQAADMADAAERLAIPGGPEVQSVMRIVDADAAVLKTLAAAITAAAGFVVVLLSASRPSLVVVARSADVPVAADRVVGALVAAFGGRGGGRSELAQGGGLDGPSDAIFAEARRTLGSAQQ
jgi:alanyl-tRNA synthetase